MQDKTLGRLIAQIAVMSMIISGEITGLVPTVGINVIVNIRRGYVKTPEEIYSLYRSRRRLRGPLIARMEDIRTAYNGELAIPMAELSAYEKAAVPNLVAQGIDQTATRIASTVPNIMYPPTKPGVKREEENARKRRAANL